MRRNQMFGRGKWQGNRSRLQVFQQERQAADQKADILADGFDRQPGIGIVDATRGPRCPVPEPVEPFDPAGMVGAVEMRLQVQKRHALHLHGGVLVDHAPDIVQSGDRNQHIAEQRLSGSVLIGDAQIGLAKAHGNIAKAVDAEQGIGKGGPEGWQARHEPQLGPVGIGDDVDFAGAL